MDKLVRCGVSLEENLLRPFDDLCARKGYASRSEAVRDLIRKSLAEDEWSNAEGIRAGTLTLVYDHHKHDLARRLMALEHADHDIILSTMHLHLDHYNCLEVLVLKGEASRVRTLAEKLLSCKGVKQGAFAPASFVGTVDASQSGQPH